MSLANLSPGADVPDEITVVIEIPANSSPVKYEFDKDTGLIAVDRFMAAPMFYPCNYGFIPNTLSEDGDPIDVLVHTPYPLVAGCTIACRPVGVLNMKDEAGPGRQAGGAAEAEADVGVRRHRRRRRPARAAQAADRALLHALQGAREGQVGRDRGLGPTPPTPSARSSRAWSAPGGPDEPASPRQPSRIVVRGGPTLERHEPRRDVTDRARPRRPVRLSFRR